MSIILVLLALAAGVRIYRVDAAELWLDEACTYRFADMSQGELLHALFTTEGHPPVYYEFMMLWHRLGGSYGTSETWLRLPSLVAGVAMVFATGRIAHRLLPNRDAWIAAFCVALSPLAIYYSLEARHYAILAALGAFTWIQLERYVREGDRRAGITSAVLLAVATGTHFIALFIVPLPLLWSVLQTPGMAAFKRSVLRIQILWIVAATPALILALLRLSEGNPGTAWLEAQPVHIALYESLQALSGSGPYPSYLGYLGLTSLPSALHYLALALVAVGLIMGLKPGPHRTEQAGLVSWLLLTMVAPALFSLIKPIYLPGRYELAALPVLIVMVVYGWSRLAASLSSSVRSAALCTLVLLLNVPTLWQFMPQTTTRPWSNLVAKVALAPDTPVVCTDLTCPPVRWALAESGHSGLAIGYPSDVQNHPCWRSKSPLRREQLLGEVAALTEAIATEHPTLAIAGEFIAGTTKPAGWSKLAPLFQALEAKGYKGARPDAMGGMWLMRWTRN